MTDHHIKNFGLYLLITVVAGSGDFYIAKAFGQPQSIPMPQNASVETPGETQLSTDLRSSNIKDKTSQLPSIEQKTNPPIIQIQSGAQDNLLTVNFENVDIRDCIRILAEKSKANIVIGPDVNAVVSLQLAGVTWQKALEIILRTYNLTSKQEGDLIRIMTLDQLNTEEEKLPLETRIITLNFARASETKSNFENMLSSRGKIAINDRMNSMIVTDLPENISKIEMVVEKLDNRTPQVMIEALMADVVINQDDQLGINWDLAWPDTIADGSSMDGRTPKRTLEQNFGALAAPGGIIKFGTTLLTDKDLHATIVAWQQQSRVNILAHPRIMTLDNLPARINLTEEIPYQQQTTSTESSSAVVSTSFKEAGITLSVTPHITTKDNFIYLLIDVKQSFRSGFTPDNQPIIDSRSAITNLLVRNRETAVIGGLRKKNDTFAVNKLPILGDLPLIGAVFRKRVEALNDTDLMIFVTPTIVSDIVLTDKEQDRLDLFQEETEDWATAFDRVKSQKKKMQEAVQKRSDKSGIVTEKFYIRPPKFIEETQ